MIKRIFLFLFYEFIIFFEKIIKNLLTYINDGYIIISKIDISIIDINKNYL